MEKLYAHQNEGGDGLIFEDAPTGGTVAIVKDERYLHIIAAAPEMLAALKALVETTGYYEDTIAAARDAIRKAQGDE